MYEGCNSLVNDGKYAYAISIFDKILQEEPDYAEALIGRGTAYAFQRELHAADFSKAIQSNPAAGEAWKRRGQAWAALGEYAKKTYYKIASLISNSYKSIALIAGQTSEVSVLAYDYGKNLGIITAPILFVMEEFPEL
ncbi:suppressor of rps4-rld 1 [Phtheirospermum japonicum]|uniref:Suppressor of rps4-rld 1 n=1 Tax=Phtheirospermum japonicum TaxID=374723 RepID=A0A830BZP3_9LAMI|nr:suppressor of rps4-rld 1 [Phtheirospermum japonicum]